jgi:hypothetical protein
MVALVGRRVRTSQPLPWQAQLIDWANPITRDMVLCLSHADQAYGYAVNSSGTAITSAAYTNGSQSNTPIGTGVRAASNMAYSAPSGLTGTNYSLFAVGTATSAVVTQSALDMDNGSARYYQFRLANGKVDFIPFNSSAAVTGQATSPVALTLTEMTNGFTMGATASPTRTAVFQNGKITTATPSGLIAVGNSFPVAVGARQTASQSWGTGALMLVAMWNRTLADAEMQSLADNPWQLFKPAMRRLYMAPAPAGTGASLLPDPYSSSIATGAPQVSSTANQWLTPNGGAMIGAPGAATLSQTFNQWVTAPGTNGTFTSDAPGLAQTASQWLTPGAASVSQSAFPVSITQSIVTSINPGNGVLAGAAGAPGVVQTANQIITANGGSMVLASSAPILTQTTTQALTPDSATGTLSGYAPSVVQAPMAPDSRYARPLSDVSDGTWTPSAGTSLADMINEQAADDSTYISTSSASICRMKLGPVVNPGTTSGQVMRYRAGSSTGNGLKVRLTQGAVLIAEWMHAQLPTQQTTFAQSLTALQCAAITDYTNLFLEFEAF